MSHMPVGEQPASSGYTVKGRVVRYTATGSEGTDFFVPVGVTLADDEYDVVFTPQSVAAFPAFDLPNDAAGDRTRTEFRFRISDPLTAGDKLVFLLFK